ncbi:hypothetical protein BDA99DRAFT_442302 [Phascolomyces articulosus]|uniref:SGTA homodimerisation domain-containing protein n=1 Tax=Phascolomyces articulosus TaxID=60185 RepID=A0AAD5K477_9FUNG|nr:hypothetical protein BDA99DRAFT_442302 [Phascolomyces articulosus]
MAPENKKALVYSILEFLQKSCDDGTINKDDTEGIEVAMQCIGEAFGVDPTDAAQQEAYSTKPANLLSIFEVYLKTKSKSQKGRIAYLLINGVVVWIFMFLQEISEEDKKKAEELKAAGNRKVAERNYPEAIKLYTEAIQINGAQAVYYANRAAAYSQQGDYDKAVSDANSAIEIDPKYSKGYSRLGHALFCQQKYQEAVDAYEQGLALDPENATIKSSMATAKSKIGSVDRAADSSPSGTRGAPSAGAGGMPDFASLLNNPQLMNMAQQMMQSGALDQIMNNPNLARMAQNMMGGGGGGNDGAGGAPGGAGLADMLNNPEMMEMARQFMGGGNNGNNNGSGNNSN